MMVFIVKYDFYHVFRQAGLANQHALVELKFLIFARK